MPARCCLTRTLLFFVCAQVSDGGRRCACVRVITSKCRTNAVNIYLGPLLLLSPATLTVKLGAHRRTRGALLRIGKHTQPNAIFLCSVSRRWHVAGKSECSAKCGPGYRTLDVQCMKYGLMKRQSERTETGACGNIAKPQTRESCHGDCLLKSWQYSAWSQVQLMEEF